MFDQFLASSLSSEKGLDFVFHLCSILIFLLFIWYICGVNYKSEIERKRHNKLAFLLFLIIISLSVLQIIGIILFFPSINLSLNFDKIMGIPIVTGIFLITAFILDRIRKKKFRR